MLRCALLFPGRVLRQLRPDGGPGWAARPGGGVRGGASAGPGGVAAGADECPTCGVVVFSHGRREVELIDAPCFGRPVRVVWWKRTWWCPEPACPVGVFTEQDEQIARPRGLLTTRACWWAVRQLRREHASVLGLARQLGTTWKTVWRSIRPLLEVMDADPSRFDGVEDPRG